MDSQNVRLFCRAAIGIAAIAAVSVLTIDGHGVAAFWTGVATLIVLAQVD